MATVRQKPWHIISASLGGRTAKLLQMRSSVSPRRALSSRKRKIYVKTKDVLTFTTYLVCDLRDVECKTGPSVPVPVIVPAPIDFLNAANFVELLGASAYCTPNTLPRLPL